jgi:hypothetical protein
MRFLPPFAVLAAALVPCTLADEPGKAEPLPRKGLVVHEWGIFRVHNDIDLANADMRAVWDGLPKFVYGQVSGRDLPRFWRNVELVDKPVLFFHSPDPIDVELRIDFPTGFPGVWWPGTQTPAIRYGTLTPAAKDGEPFRFLEWQLSLKEPPKGMRKDVAMHPVEDKHWVKTLRAVQADDVFARVGEQNQGCERERFVYYDGLLPRGKWVEITVEKEKIALANRAEHPVFDVTVVDRRTAGHTRVARMAKLDSKATIKELEFKEEDAKDWPASGHDALTRQLKDAGLFEDEAKSLVELWKEELFSSPGLTLFYRLPQEEYDRLLPLKMKPRPEKLARVGLVQHPHCEPDLAERVAALAKDLDNDDFETRERAQNRLDEIGRAAFVHLVKLRKQIKGAEAQRRLDELLEKHDAEKAFKR